MWRSVLLAAALGLGACAGSQAQSRAAPDIELREKGEAVQLYIDGAPFIMLGGEVGNSTASNLEHFAENWDTYAALDINTLLVPVYWELVEPVEGEFDFSLLGGLIDQARANDTKLVILWFGTWKNSMSTYVPAWVKRDGDRFPRARDAEGRAQDILSPYGAQTVAADARAFTAMMAYLAKVDPGKDTVILVQIENEMGMLPEARDRSALGDAAWAAPVPQAMINYLTANRETLHPELKALWEGQGAPVSGSWAEVFGDSLAAQEVFTAWGLAQFTEVLAKAGRAEHDLPFFVNAALDRPGVPPGGYPSGGPLDHLIDVWRAGAPNVDIIAPDIYFPNFTERVGPYDVPGNAVFIPEANRPNREESAAEFLWAVGELDAIGFAPFSIEDMAPDHVLGDAYRVVADMLPLIIEAQGTDRMSGLKADVTFDGKIPELAEETVAGRFVTRASFRDPWTPVTDQNPAHHGGFIIEVGEDEFIVVGRGVTLTFKPLDEAEGFVGIERAEAGYWRDGAWVTELTLNGDQTHQGRHIRLTPDGISVQRFKLYTFK